MIGKFPAKLDEKNRLFVPAKLRAELGEDFYVTLGFNWGKKFNHRNPSIYYDDTNPDDTNPGGGASIPDETMREEMKKFTTLLHYGKDFTGLYPTDEKDLPELSFTAILTAEIN